MTMREELIEGGAKAIFRAEGKIASQEGDPWFDVLHEFQRDHYRRLSTANLDAILAGLSEPSEEMVEAFWDGMDDFYPTRENIPNCLRAMLKPLKGDAPSRPSDPGIPMYRFPDGTPDVLGD